MHIRDVVMVLFGPTHTVNTTVGNDFIRGISSGERKQVSILECTLVSAPSSVGVLVVLTAPTPPEFIRTVRMGADTGGSTALISVYQCSQSSYDVSLAIQQSEQY